MNIGIVCFAWGKDHRGGLETHISGLAKLFCKAGHKVFIHCVDHHKEGDQFETKCWKEGELHLQEMNYNLRDTRCLFDLQRVPQAETILINWIHQNQLDIVDFHHNLFFGIRAIKICSKHAPTVATLHDYWSIDPHAQLFSSNHSIVGPQDHMLWESNAKKTWPDRTQKSLESLQYYQSTTTDKNNETAQSTLKKAWANYSEQILGYASAIVTPSIQSAEIHRAHGITRPIRVIENGLNISFRRGQMTEEKASCTTPLEPQNPIKIGILGTILPHKGQLKFCEAVLACRLNNKINIELFGPFPSSYHGDEKPQQKLFKLAQESPKSIFFRGEYDKELLPSIFSRLDLIAMPSLWHEVYGFVAREAIAYGLPIITTDAGGLINLRDKPGVITLPMDKSDSWSHYLNEAFEEGPLFKWIYQRRKKLPIPSDFIPSNTSCAEALEALYLKLIKN